MGWLWDTHNSHHLQYRVYEIGYTSILDEIAWHPLWLATAIRLVVYHILPNMTEKWRGIIVRGYLRVDRPVAGFQRNPLESMQVSVGKSFIHGGFRIANVGLEGKELWLASRWVDHSEQRRAVFAVPFNQQNQRSSEVLRVRMGQVIAQLYDMIFTRWRNGSFYQAFCVFQHFHPLYLGCSNLLHASSCLGCSGNRTSILCRHILIIPTFLMIEQCSRPRWTVWGWGLYYRYIGDDHHPRTENPRNPVLNQPVRYLSCRQSGFSSSKMRGWFESLDVPATGRPETGRFLGQEPEKAMGLTVQPCHLTKWTKNRDWNGLTTKKYGFEWDLMVIYWELVVIFHDDIVIWWGYTVRCHQTWLANPWTKWRSLMGNLSIDGGISISMFDYQRVSQRLTISYYHILYTL